MDIIDKLLETPCYIMDFLPKQVPMNCGGQFFEVETYLLNHYNCCGLRDRFVGVILKAMCYYPVSVQWGKWIEQPTPEQVTKIIDTILDNHSDNVNILFTSKDVLLQFEWDCLNISIWTLLESKISDRTILKGKCTVWKANIAPCSPAWLLPITQIKKD